MSKSNDAAEKRTLTDLGYTTEQVAQLEDIAAKPVSITVELHPDVALQLAQFAKRSTFNTFYEFTEAHLTHDERQKRAYQMTSGMQAIGAALAVTGYAPR